MGSFFYTENKISIPFSIEDKKLEIEAYSETNYFKNISIKGCGFLKLEEAKDFGEKIITSLKIMGTSLKIGIDTGLYIIGDIGKNKSSSGLSKRHLDKLEDSSGTYRLNDKTGLLVYSEDRPVCFEQILFNGPVVDGRLEKVENIINEIKKAFMSFSFNINEKDFLALDLYSMSHFESSPRARFLALICAVECLVEQKKQKKEVKEHIDKLIEYTKDHFNSCLKADVLSRLGGLKKESISKACQRLVGDLLGEEDKKQFMDWYKIRNDLVHNGCTEKEIDFCSDTLKLDTLVSRLLLKRIKNNKVDNQT